MSFLWRESKQYLVITLNRLKDRQVRFEFQRSWTEKIELMFKPTIGSHDQNFLGNWYSKLKQFSWSLMKDRVQFCDKITTESLLKSNTIQEQFKLFETEIKNNFEIKTESYHPFMTHQGYGRKQPLRGVPRKRCSENMQQICRRTPMPKCYFNKVAL